MARFHLRLRPVLLPGFANEMLAVHDRAVAWLCDMEHEHLDGKLYAQSQTASLMVC